MGRTGFCENPRFPVVFCEDLRFPAVFYEHLRLWSEFGSVCPIWCFSHWGFPWSFGGVFCSFSRVFKGSPSQANPWCFEVFLGVFEKTKERKDREGVKIGSGWLGCEGLQAGAPSSGKKKTNKHKHFRRDGVRDKQEPSLGTNGTPPRDKMGPVPGTNRPFSV